MSVVTSELLTNLRKIIISQELQLSALLEYRERYPKIDLQRLITQQTKNCELCYVTINALGKDALSLSSPTSRISSKTPTPYQSMDAVYEKICADTGRMIESTLGRAIPFDLKLTLRPDETIH